MLDKRKKTPPGGGMYYDRTLRPFASSFITMHASIPASSPPSCDGLFLSLCGEF